MLEFEEYHSNNYTQKQLDEIIKLITNYNWKQKKEIALLLMDLANIYLNSNIDFMS